MTWEGCGPAEIHRNAFFAGEVEPCINGQVAAVGAYFRQDVRGLVDRLLAEQLPDGGWNCDAEIGSTRSSFNTTICVLDALLEYERNFGDPAVTAGAPARTGLPARATALPPQIDRRSRSSEDRKSGASWQRFAFPTWWHYDLLRALDYLRARGVAPDERVADAIAIVAASATIGDKWPLETQYPGRMPVDIDEGEGRPSRWNTLRALRVLDWYSTRS